MHRFTLLVLLLLLASLSTVCPSDEDNDEDSINKPYNITIIGVGLLSKKLYIFTEDLVVFELDSGAVKNGANLSEMFLKTGMTLDEKWPKLGNDSRFQDIRYGHLDMIYFVLQDDCTIVNINAKSHKGYEAGLRYIIEKDTVESRYIETLPLDRQTMVTSPLKKLWYSFERVGDSITASLCILIPHLKAVTSAANSNKRLCAGEKADEICFVSPVSTNCNQSTLITDVANGFIDGSRVVLFGDQFIYTFDYEVFNFKKSKQSNDISTSPNVKVCRSSYYHYHDCYKFPWWWLLLLLLLLLLALLIYCCFDRIKKRFSKTFSKVFGNSPMSTKKNTRKTRHSVKKRSTKKSVKSKKSTKHSAPMSHARSVKKTKKSFKTIKSIKSNKVKVIVVKKSVHVAGAGARVARAMEQQPDACLG